MSNVRTRGEQVRRFIISKVDAHPKDIAKRTADHFKITRQAVNKHLAKLVDDNTLCQDGSTRNSEYKLCSVIDFNKTYLLDHKITESDVWRIDILPLIGKLPDNVIRIWHHSFTEMLNNVIDHSDANHVTVTVKKTAATTQIDLYDDGVGIFKKIQKALNLIDERHSVLELAKGKFTTDPANHSGEGIFFTSRMFDDFIILSGNVYFSHKFGKNEDWILESIGSSGTLVRMKLNNHTSRTTKKIFDEFSSGEDDYSFYKTIVPVRMAQYGDDNLVSRSQAKRLLTRIDRFKVVIFDFSGIDSIGQAFADELFRVFQNNHPEIELTATNANTDVKQMINRARSLRTGI